MSGHQLKITAGQMGGPGTVVELDGQEIQRALVGLDYHLRAGDPTAVTLDVFAPEVVVAGEVEVRLREETQALLKRLGWTPPEETP